MKKAFQNYILEEKLLKNSKKILLAVSAGPDSMAMLDLFLKSQKKFELDLAVVHLNHMFREKAEAEADYLQDFLKAAAVDFYYKKVNLPKIIKENNISAEAAARQERFKFFRQIINKYNYDLLALAHHRDDQAETILLNLFRGSGLEGLSGIQAAESLKGLNIIHPMLKFSKKEILNYCRENNLNPKFDKSNEQNIYSRNIIRNEILPVAEEKINKNARAVIARNSSLISEENVFLQKLARKKYQNIVKNEAENKILVDIEKLKKTDLVLRRRIYRHIYQHLNTDLDDLYLNHILEIEKILFRKKTGTGVDIASGIRVEISYSNLVFLKNSSVNQITKKKVDLDKKILKINKQQSLEIKIISRAKFSFSNDHKRAAFDYDQIKLPLFIRRRKDGDKMLPLGMEGHKKIKDILIDKKVPKYNRDKIPLLVDREDNIIWLLPYKISGNYKVDKFTKKVLVLKLKNK